MHDRPHDAHDDGVSYRGVAVGAAVVAVAIGVALSSAFVLLHINHITQLQSSVQPGPMAGPVSAPRLQAAPETDIAAYRQEKQRELTSYGWVDRAKGTVRIPIARAMVMLVTRSTGGSPR